MKPLKTAQYAAEAAQFRDTVNSYRDAKLQTTPPPQSLTTKRRRQLHHPAPAARALDRPTEIPGYPLNDSPPAEAPDYRTMQTAHIVARARKAQGRNLIETLGPSELRKVSREHE
jgi:hypothetical protein